MHRFCLASSTMPSPLVYQRPINLICGILTIPRRFHIVRSPLPPVSVPTENYVKFLHRDLDHFSDRPAIIDDVSGESFSYTQLKQATLGVTNGLRRTGLVRGSRICLFTNNRPEFIFALHGAVAGGFVASPINCHCTPGELEHPVRMAEPSVIVTDRDRLPVVKKAISNCSSVKQVYLIGESETRSRELGCLPFDRLLNSSATDQLYANIDAENDLAYLPYSSGTSGLSKGVMLSHSNVSANNLMTQSLLENEIGSEIVAGILPFFHLLAMTVVLGNVIQTGGTIVAMPKFDPEQFLVSIEKYKIDQLILAPPLVLFLLQHPLVKKFDLSSLKRMMSGGSPLGKEVELEAIEKFPNCDIFQVYGLTETATIFICPRKNRRPAKRSSIGSAGVSVPNQEVKVVDLETRKILGVGEIGEIAVRGPHVMKGYLGLPGATSECIDEDGWLYTGDVGFYDENHYFFITDRIKELIKYKLFPVAPAEVESVLLSHPLISDCAVVGRQNQRVGEEAVGFIVRQSTNLKENDIHDFLKSRLAPHKQLHGGIIFVDSIPKSTSGKLLRRHLRDQLNKQQRSSGIP